jgi:hypothetical protein
MGYSEEISQMIEDCEKRQSKLSEWEQDFIQSISEKDSLTEKQIGILEKIWEKVT